MKNLATWQKVIAWGIIVLAFPFAAAWRVYVACKWRVWAGKIFLTHGLRR